MLASYISSCSSSTRSGRETASDDWMRQTQHAGKAAEVTPADDLVARFFALLRWVPQSAVRASDCSSRCTAPRLSGPAKKVLPVSSIGQPDPFP